MEHGRISQRGRFDELLETDGPFRRLAKELKGSEDQLQGGVSDADLQSEPVTGSRASNSARVASSEPE